MEVAILISDIKTFFYVLSYNDFLLLSDIYFFSYNLKIGDIIIILLYPFNTNELQHNVGSNLNDIIRETTLKIN